MATSSSLGAAMGGRQHQGHCEKHGPFEGRAWRLGGEDRYSPCPECAKERAQAAAEQAAEARRRAVAEQAAAAAAEALAVSQLPKRFFGKTFETYVVDGPKQQGVMTTCRQYAEDFAEHRAAGTGLTLSGGPGTGKSHLAAAIIQTIVPQRSALYATVSDLVRAVRDTWRRDSPVSTGQMVERLRKLDLLVLDEIGVQSGTDGEHMILYDVLDGRYRDCSPTLLLTNLDSPSLQQAMGDRLFDRLRETSKWVKCDWESYRPRARSERAS